MSARRVSDEQRRAVLEDYLKEVPDTVIAARYGVSENYARYLAQARGLVSPRKIREMKLWQRARHQQA